MSTISLTSGDYSATRRRIPSAARNEFDHLLAAVGAGRDGEAFDVLFDHFGPRVHALMVRLGLAPFAAEDVTQDVMETIWRKAHLYDPHKAGAATWIFHVARNRRIDITRRSRETSFAPEHFLALPDPAIGSDDQLDADRRDAQVRAAIDVLPRAQRALVQLAFFDGLSHCAIAERLDLPLGTVKSRLRLAFGHLRRLLREAGITDAWSTQG